MKKIRFCLFLIIALCFSSISCNRQKVESIKSKDNNPITIRIWSIWSSESESNRQPFLKTIEELRLAYPKLNIELTQNENEVYKTKIKTAIAANEGPDVFYYSSGGILKSFVDAKKVLALDEYLNNATMERLQKESLGNMIFEGKLYQLPYSLACSVLFCNKELFSRYGAKIPETWDELIEAVKIFKKNNITPMTLGAKDRWCFNMYTDIILNRCAGYKECENTFYKKTNGSFSTEKMRMGFKKIKELIDAGAFSSDALMLTRNESEIPFYAGSIPMYMTGNWVAANCHAHYSYVKDKIVAIPFPVIEGGAGGKYDFMGGAAEGFCVNANSKHKEEAVKVCAFIAENHSKNVYRAGAGIPTWKMDFESEKTDPLTKEIITLTNKATSFLLWGNTALAGDDTEKYMDLCQEFLAGNISEDEICSMLDTIFN